MTPNGWLQIGFFFLAILAVTKPLGRFMARVFARERTWLDPVLRPIEKGLYAVTSVDESRHGREADQPGRARSAHRAGCHGRVAIAADGAV